MASLRDEELPQSSMDESDILNTTEYAMSVQNRFKQMNNGGQGLSENGGFQTVQRRTKRKKVSSSNMDTFANMDIDSKLVCMFEKMNVIEDTISECRNDIIKVNSNYKLIDA